MICATNKAITGVLHGDQMAVLTPEKVDEFYNHSSAQIKLALGNSQTQAQI